MGNTAENTIYREASIDGILDKEERTIKLTFSSESPVQDWHKTYNILGHEKGECNLTRLNKNAPALLGHNVHKHIGAVKRAWIEDKKGYAEIKISRSKEGEDAWIKIEEGILTGVSVGAAIDEVKLISDKDGVRTYRSTQWTPYEITLTPLPADLSVGVGREERLMPNNIKRSQEQGATPQAQAGTPATATPATPEQATVPVPAVPAAPAPQEPAQRGLSSQEIAKISTIGRECGLATEALEAIERGESPDAFTERCLRLMRSSNAPARQPAGNRESLLGLNRNETQRFSIAKLVRAQAYPQNATYREAAALELECVRAMGGEQGSSLAIPQEVLRSWSATRAVDKTAMSGLTQDHLDTGSFVEMLRAESTLLQRVTMRTGLTGNHAYPVQTEKTKASWVGIDKPLSTTGYATSKNVITPSKLGAIVDINESALLYAGQAVEQDLRKDITEAIAEAMIHTILYGTGAGDIPLGIMLNPAVQKVLFEGASPTFAEIVAMHSKIKAKMAASGSLLYLINSATEGHFLTTPKNNGLQAPILTEAGSKLNGRDYEASEFIEEGHVFYGNLSEIYVGVWDSFKIEVNPYAESKWSANTIQLKAYQVAGMQIRRPEALCFGTMKP